MDTENFSTLFGHIGFSVKKVKRRRCGRGIGGLRTGNIIKYLWVYLLDTAFKKIFFLN